MSLDVTCVPELVPGVETKKGEVIGFGDFIDEIKLEKVPLLKILMIYNLASFIPSILYRLSIKATTLIYLPFLFIIHQTFKNQQPMVGRLCERRDAAWFKLVRFVSAILMAIFAVKLAILLTEQYQARWFKDIPALEIFSLYWLPGKLALWQIAAPVNSLLSFALFFFVDFAIRRLESGVWSEGYITNWLHSLFLIRGVLSLYTIICTLYITVRHASHWSWGWLDFAVFPW